MRRLSRKAKKKKKEAEPPAMPGIVAAGVSISLVEGTNVSLTSSVPSSLPFLIRQAERLAGNISRRAGASIENEYRRRGRR